MRGIGAMGYLRNVVLGVVALTVAGLSVGVSRTVTYTSPAETVVSIGSSKDNTLYEDPAGSLSNSAGQYFFVGRTSTIVDRIRRGVLAFDIAGNVPAGSTVTSVSLTLHMSRSISGPQSIELHKILADWGEGSSVGPGEEGMGAGATTGDATWIHRFFDTATWASPGGDFSATVSASTIVGLTVDDYTWTSAQMVANVQSWLDSPSTNFGWSLTGNEATDTTAKRFDTKENLIPEVRPLLTVNFESQPAQTPTEEPSDTPTPTPGSSVTPSEETPATPTGMVTPFRVPAAGGQPAPDGRGPDERNVTLLAGAALAVAGTAVLILSRRRAPSRRSAEKPRDGSEC